MKNYKNLFLVFGFSLFFTFGYSQFSVGIKGAVNLNSIQLNGIADDFRPDIHWIAGGIGGIVGAYQFNPNFQVQTEINYAERGFKAGKDFNVDLFEIPIPLGATIESRFHYLDIPVLFDYIFGNEKVQGFVGVGPYFSYALDGKLSTQLQLIVDINVNTTKLNLDQQIFDRTEFGAVAHTGIRIPVSERGKFVGDLRYNHAFTKIADDGFFDIRLRNKGISLGLGYVVSF